jgi:hypothetical protein
MKMMSAGVMAAAIGLIFEQVPLLLVGAFIALVGGLVASYDLWRVLR